MVRVFFFSSRRRHTRFDCDWSSDVCSSDLLPTVTAVMIPSGIDDGKVRNQLLDEFNIEIAGGFGAVKGKIWRVGLMGYCSQKPFVLLFLAALEKCLLEQGFRVPSGAGVGAAIRSYSQVETAAAAVS